jgi:ribonuclease BN (tRNA processing enzyme)
VAPRRCIEGRDQRHKLAVPTFQWLAAHRHDTIAAAVLKFISLANRVLAVAALLGSVSCATGNVPGNATSVAANGCGNTERPYSRFELAVLGSGGPSSFGRAASSYVVLIDRVPRILVDAGPGTFLRLGEMGLEPRRIDTVLLTHLHIDHSGDLAAFVLARDLSFDEPMTLRIFGPAGGGDFPSTSAFVHLLFDSPGAFGYLKKFRNELRFEVGDLPVRADAPIDEVLHDGDLRVTSIAVDHGDVPAVAFRIEQAGHVLVVSGDLASKNDNLSRLAVGADLLVYDTTVLDPPGSPRSLYELHTPPRRIGEIAAAAGVKSILLSHLTQPVLRSKEAVIRSVRAAYPGEVTMAEDCMRIDLTSR